ncbi:hypothetical protein J4526_09295 [Desulfurococcaceae archaeon MEX13E-LK6-19]|nr:hypothetical protein J4526_09295 [Desulfurococcaceae archaeon MEX13E-LK6-19]
MEYIYEKIKNELKASLSTAKTIDYYLIKLDSAIYMFKDYVENVDDTKIRELLDYLSDIFQPLACHKDIVLSQAKSPRFPSLRKHYVVIEEWLSTLECSSEKKLIVETPSAPPVYLKEQLFKETREKTAYKEEKITTFWDYIKRLFKKLFKKRK